MKRPPTKHAGFTLIELLIVMVILIILISAVFVFLDPVRRFNQARNTVRRTDAGAIAKAVSQTLSDTSETLPPEISVLDRKWRMIGKAPFGCSVPCGDLGTTTHALQFFDSGSFLDIPNASPYNFDFDTPFTISAWISLDNVHGFNPIISKMLPGGGGGYILFAIDKSIAFAVMSPLADGLIQENLLTEGEFTHIVVTYNGNRAAPVMKLYIDGKNVLDRNIKVPHASDSFASNAKLQFGGRAQVVFPLFPMPISVQDNLRGILDDVRMYDGVLSDEDIVRVKNGGEHQDVSIHLIGHWMFDEGSGETTEDSSNNDSEAYLHGRANWVNTVAPFGRIETVNGLHYELPSACINLADALVSTGVLPKLPLNPSTDELDATEDVTYYAIRNINGLITVRSCLAEGEGRQGGGEPPIIEVSR